MPIEFVNFNKMQPIFQEEDRLLKPLFKKLKKSKTRFLVIRETWINQEDLIKLIQGKYFDAIVSCSCMDEPTLDYNFLKNIPTYKIGYYKDSPYYFDFHSYMVSKYLKIDSTISCDHKQISIPFMSLNGKPHNHRIKLVKELIENDLTKRNIVSLNPNNFYDNYNLSLTVDSVNTDSITPSPFEVYTLGNTVNWHKHFLNVTTETVYDTENRSFVTEKIYKPILGYKPFLVYSENGSINLLMNFGFEVYNFDFLDICDLDLTDTNNYVKFLKILSTQDVKYLRYKYQSLKEKILYNRNHFFNHVNAQLEVVRNINID